MAKKSDVSVKKKESTLSTKKNLEKGKKPSKVKFTVPKVARIKDETLENAIKKLEKVSLSSRVKVNRALEMVENWSYTGPKPEVKYVEDKGAIPTFQRSRAYHDKHGFQYTGFRLCPYEICKDWLLVFGQNRLTVINDMQFDHHIRPIYTYYNINTIPLKSQIDIYHNYQIPKKAIKSADWLGTRELDENGEGEVQLLIGDKTGAVVRIDLQQRSVVNELKLGAEVHTIASHYDTNVFAVLDEKNVVRAYSVDLLSRDMPNHFGTCEIKEKVIEMRWMGDVLLCMTQAEFIEIDVKPREAAKTKAKKPKTLKWKITYSPENTDKNELASFQWPDDKTICIQRQKGGEIEFHDYKKQEKTSVVKVTGMKKSFGWAVHPTKRILAFSTKKNEMFLVNCKTSAILQKCRPRGAEGCTRSFMAWSTSRRDNLLHAGKNRVSRYCSEWDRLVDSKPTRMPVYYDQDLPFRIDWSAMDYCNIDHDHRAYQWHWNDDDISAKFHSRDFRMERRKKELKLLDMDKAIAERLQELGGRKIVLPNGGIIANPERYPYSETSQGKIYKSQAKKRGNSTDPGSKKSKKGKVEVKVKNKK